MEKIKEKIEKKIEEKNLEALKASVSDNLILAKIRIDLLEYIESRISGLNGDIAYFTQKNEAYIADGGEGIWTPELKDKEREKSVWVDVAVKIASI